MKSRTVIAIALTLAASAWSSRPAAAARLGVSGSGSIWWIIHEQYENDYKQITSEDPAADEVSVCTVAIRDRCSPAGPMQSVRAALP